MPTKLDTLQRIEIAEGVEIQLRLAGPLPRGLAFMIDSLIKGGILVGISMMIGFLAAALQFPFGSEISEGVSNGLLLVGGFLLEFGYSIGFEVSPWSATPGKRAMGLRVARTSGAPITWHQAVVRNMLRMIDFLPFGGVTGVITCLCNDRFQRLGDLAADTVVMHVEATRAKDSSGRLEGIPPFRPGASLTREEQGAILQYADRVGEWPEQRAEELAGHIRGLTRVAGVAGVSRILGMARWIRGAG